TQNRNSGKCRLLYAPSKESVVLRCDAQADMTGISPVGALLPRSPTWVRTVALGANSPCGPMGKYWGATTVGADYSGAMHGSADAWVRERLVTTSKRHADTISPII